MIHHTHIQLLCQSRDAFKDIPAGLIEYDCLPKTVGAGQYAKFYRGVHYRYHSVNDILKQLSAPVKDEPLLLNHLFRQLLLGIIGGFSLSDYHAYKLYSRPIQHILRELICYFRRQEVRDRYNCRKCSLILRNKILASRYFKFAGIPYSNMVAFCFNKEWFVIDGTRNINLKRDILVVGKDIKEGTYILKPAFERWGQGVELVEKANTNNTNLLRASSVTILLEDKLNNIDLLKPKGSVSLNTFRVMTEFVPESGPKVFSAAVRIGLSGSLIDNWSAGGIAAPIDVENGKIGRFFKKGIGEGAIECSLTNMILPDWEKIIDLAIKAHTLIPGVTSIGWDIAYTTNGIVIVEGNDDWDIVLPQRLAAQSGFFQRVLPNYMFENIWP